MKKRILSILLILCMVLALVPATAFADEPAVLKGDVDLDGEVAIKDAIALQKYLEGMINLIDEALAVADFNEDGVVNYSDLTELQSHLNLPVSDITVENGKATAGGTEISKAASYTRVTLTANSPSDNMVFDKWVVNLGGVTLADASSATTTFTMSMYEDPVSVTATYKPLSADEKYSLAITVDGFQVGNTPNDITLSFASTIPGVTFTEDDFSYIDWFQFVFDGSFYRWYLAGSGMVFEAGTRYRCFICLDNKGLTEVPTVTVNGNTPGACGIVTRDGVPIQLQIDCELGTPELSQYTITYDGGEGVEGSIPAGVKTHGEDFTLSSETFTLDGCVQTGWVDEQGVFYELGGTYTEDQDVTLYPYWERIITLTVPYTTTVEQGGDVAPGEKTFTLALIGDSAPDADKSNVTITGSVTTDGAGDYDGTLTITGPEETLWYMLSEGAFVQQVDDGEAGWTVDDTVWGLLMSQIAAYSTDDSAAGYTMLVVPASIDEFGCYYIDWESIDWENVQTADMTFTNTYTAHAYELKHDATHHWDECGCGDVQNKELHKYGDWKVTKEATETAVGEKEHTCTVCGYTETAEIAKLPATTNPDTKPETKPETKPDTDTKPDTTSPQTGDNSHMALWLALLFVSGAGVIGTTVYGKKKRAK